MLIPYFFTLPEIHSVGNSVTLQAFPQRLSFSIYPINAMLRAVLLLLQQNKWLNIASIADSSTISQEPFHRGFLAGLANVFGRNDSLHGVQYIAFECNASADSTEIAGTLRVASETSRSMWQIDIPE